MGLGKLADGVGHLGLREQQVVRPGEGEALIRVIGTGVCGTDLHIADDEFPYEAPVTMGHEVTGHVETVGSEADSAWVGKRVATETYFSYCQKCGQCRSGRPNLCERRRSIGSREDGGFTAWMRIPVRNLWEIPDHVGLYAGALAEPLACVTNCLLDPPVINAGDHVLVTGPGTMGLLTAQVARAAGGIVTVVGLEQDEMRLGLADSLGLHTMVLTDPDQPTDIAPDVVCECSGTGPAAAYCLERVSKRGRYVQVGIFGSPVTLSLDHVLYKELVVSSGNASTPASWGRAIALLRSQQVSLDPLVTEVAPLSEWSRVFDAVRGGEGLKHVLSPGEGSGS